MADEGRQGTNGEGKVALASVSRLTWQAIAALIAIVTILGGAFFAQAQAQQQMTVDQVRGLVVSDGRMGADIAALRERDVSQDAQLGLIRQELGTISAKLDRLIDGQRRPAT